MAVVDVAISMPKLALTISFVELPLAFIASPVRPDLGARSVPRAIFEVAPIDSAIFKDELLNKVETFPHGLAFKIRKLRVICELQFCWLRRLEQLFLAHHSSLGSVLVLLDLVFLSFLLLVKFSRLTGSTRISAVVSSLSLHEQVPPISQI
jgi:hypothetical protein